LSAGGKYVLAALLVVLLTLALLPLRERL